MTISKIETQREARKLLVANLRSGKFKQADGTLELLSPTGETIGNCCLGVAYRTLGLEGLPDQVGERHIMHFYDGTLDLNGEQNGCTAFMTKHVQQQFGFSTDDGAFIAPRDISLPGAWSEYSQKRTPYNIPKGQSTKLTSLNDNGMTFDEIADLIELEPEGMFND